MAPRGAAQRFRMQFRAQATGRFELTQGDSKLRFQGFLPGARLGQLAVQVTPPLFGPDIPAQMGASAESRIIIGGGPASGGKRIQRIRQLVDPSLMLSEPTLVRGKTRLEKADEAPNLLQFVAHGTRALARSASAKRIAAATAA